MTSKIVAHVEGYKWVNLKALKTSLQYIILNKKCVTTEIGKREKQTPFNEELGLSEKTACLFQSGAEN